MPAIDHIHASIEHSGETANLHTQVTNAALEIAKTVLRHIPRGDDRAAQTIARTKAYLHGFFTTRDVEDSAERAFQASVEYLGRREYAASEACLAAYCAAATLVDPNRLAGVAGAAARAIGLAVGALGARPEDIEEMQSIIESHIPDIAAYERD